MKRMTPLHLQVFNVYGYDRFYLDRFFLRPFFFRDRFFLRPFLPRPFLPRPLFPRPFLPRPLLPYSDFTGGRISHFPIDFCMGLTALSVMVEDMLQDRTLHKRDIALCGAKL